MVSDPDANIERTEVQATQGTKRPGLIYVLIGGLALVVIAFAIVWASSR